MQIQVFLLINVLIKARSEGDNNFFEVKILSAYIPRKFLAFFGGRSYSPDMFDQVRPAPIWGRPHGPG
jgi:type IV secretory pathway VirB3-like protein